LAILLVEVWKWICHNHMHMFVIYPFFLGAKKATKESAVINFCRKLTPSYQIQVGHALFLSNAVYRQPFLWAMVVNSSEVCISLTCLWKLPRAEGGDKVNVQSVLRANLVQVFSKVGPLASRFIHTSNIWGLMNSQQILLPGC
jgi:hypothetical protein